MSKIYLRRGKSIELNIIGSKLGIIALILAIISICYFSILFFSPTYYLFYFRINMVFIIVLSMSALILGIISILRYRSKLGIVAAIISGLYIISILLFSLFSYFITSNLVDSFKSFTNNDLEFHSHYFFDVVGDYVVYNFIENGASAIYASSLSNKTKIKKIAGDVGYNYVAPCIAKDLSKIAFVSIPINSEPLQVSFILSDIDGSSPRQIYKAERGDLITECLFSPNGDKVYFVKSDSFRSSSPIASPWFHDFDIYYFDILSGEVRQLTNIKAYDLYGISFNNHNEIQFYQSYFGSGDDFVNGIIIVNVSLDGGVVSYSLLDSEKKNSLEEQLIRLVKPEKLNYIIDAEINLSDNLYHTRISPDGQKLVFSFFEGEYQIFLYDFETGVVEKLSNFDRIISSSPLFFEDGKKLLFSKISYSSKDNNRKDKILELWSLNLENRSLERFR